MSGKTHLSVAAAYDAWAATYDSYDNPMVFAASRALTTDGASVGGKDCLEFGCGTGRNLAAFLGAGARSVVGFDASSAMLAQAHKTCPKARLFQADMQADVPLNTASFDHILFCLTLEHVGDLVAPLRAARRVARPLATIRIVEIHPFISLQGIAAHFRTEAGEDITMPTFSHRFADFLGAFQAADLMVLHVREWVGRDFGPDAPHKITRRGADWPWLVDWTLTPGG